jgi:hypothetical protein
MMKNSLIFLICVSTFLSSGCSRLYKLEKYIQLYAMPYSITKQNISKGQLPRLHKMLKDKKYAPYWHNIAGIIGYVSDDPNSVLALLDYFRRDDSWNMDTDIKLSGKIQSISYMGYIGGHPADVILRGCTGTQGAQVLAKNWINKNYDVDVPYFQDKQNVIDKIRNAAVTGLAYTGTKENVAFLTNLYEQERDYCEANKVKTNFFYALVDAMAIQEYVAFNGIENYKNLSEQKKPDEILTLAGRYNKLTWVEKLDSGNL